MVVAADSTVVAVVYTEAAADSTAAVGADQFIPRRCNS
jgi:hypothetical protein